VNSPLVINPCMRPSEGSWPGASSTYLSQRVVDLSCEASHKRGQFNEDVKVYSRVLPVALPRLSKAPFVRRGLEAADEDWVARQHQLLQCPRANEPFCRQVLERDPLKQCVAHNLQGQVTGDLRHQAEASPSKRAAQNGIRLCIPFPKPNEDIPGDLVHIAHQFDLLVSLWYGCLVDANGVNPEDARV